MIKVGFSLIELMIVLAIIAFLSMLALPNINFYLAKAKRAEAYIFLRALAQAEQLYFAERGEFTKDIANYWKPDAEHLYTYGFADGHSFVGTLHTPASYLSGSYARKNGFTIYAAGRIHKDKVDILSINEQNKISIVSDALN